MFVKKYLQSLHKGSAFIYHAQVIVALKAQ